MPRHLRWAAAFAIVLAALVVADRALRRATRLDQFILQGESGFDWLDHFLTRRAADRAALQELGAAVSAARTRAERLQAQYALYDYEARQGRAGRRCARALIRAITEEGQADPLTVRAWRERLQRAEDNRDGPAAIGKLAESLLLALENVPHSADHCLGLLALWQVTERHRLPDLAALVLERIHQQYPRELTAAAAYQALADHYRRTKQPGKLAAVEDSLREIRRRALRQAEAQELARQVQHQLNARQPAEAAARFCELDPALITDTDYRGLLRKLLGFHTEPGQVAEARQLVAWAADRWPVAQLPLADLAALRLTLAALQLDTGQLTDSQATLATVPPATSHEHWRTHLLARFEPPGSIVAATAADWVELAGAPHTRWRARFDAGRLTIEVEAAEPAPAAIVANRTVPDSDLWQDDCIELFLAALDSTAEYFQIVVNTRGVVTDIRHSRRMGLVPFQYAAERGWSAGAQIAVGMTTTGWQASVSIPSEKMPVVPVAGTIFFDLRRLRYVTGKQEVLGWSPGNAPDTRPAQFGLLHLPR